MPTTRCKISSPDKLLVAGASVMSTTSGKPFERVKISDFAPKKVRDQLATSDETEHREGPAATPTTASEVALATQPETDAKSHCAAPDVSHADGGTRLQAAFQDGIGAYEADLERLQAALLATRRSEVNQKVSRLPPAPQLLCVQGLRSPNDTHIEGFRLPRSLEPAYVPPPLNRNGTNVLRAVLVGIMGACAVAPPIAYLALTHHGATDEPVAITPAPKISTLETQIAALPPMPAVQREQERPPPAVQVSKERPIQPPQPPAPDRYRLQSVAPAARASGDTSRVAVENPPPSSAAASVASASPEISPARSASSADRTATRIAPEEIAMLLKQGEQLISVGDVATARVLFGRAAESGDGNAALALGATYDPVVLARLGVRGIAPDAEQAQLWYQKAREYGSSEAPAWLTKLARR